MRERFFRLPFLLITLVFFLIVVSYVLSNTHLTTEDLRAGEGSVTLRTKFPNADCTKSFIAPFPFVSFECNETDEFKEP